LSVKGTKPGELDSFLFKNHRIHTTSIDWENIHGVRITPNVYTTTKNLDELVEGIRQFARNI
ncbi:MAG TPA: aminotransferase, partial [Flavisolibacter sp.]|nr:aminotransferase [Flavisolibacter sp.]